MLKDLLGFFKTLWEPFGYLLGLPDPFKLINLNAKVERDFSWTDLQKSRKWQGIVIHHSATKDGKTNDWNGIAKYHIEEKKYGKWIGYNFGIEWDTDKFVYRAGRPLAEIGAHTKQFNSTHIGICCVGNYDAAPPKSEAWDMTKDLTKFLMKQFNIPAEKVIGHRESYDLLKVKREKTCPGTAFDMTKFRQELA